MTKVGITGHRKLRKNHIAKYEEELFLKLKHLQNIHKDIIIISSLADGADRLIIYQALKLHVEFIAVLPMPQKEYEKDFICNSRDEFRYLLYKAKKIITLKSICKDRDCLYEQAGHFVSDNSDILFALWDGKDVGLKGGTSEIVKYHNSKKNHILYHLLVKKQ